MRRRRPAGPCDGFLASSQMSRRAALEAGSVTAAGLGLSQLWTGRASAALQDAVSPARHRPGFGKAKHCILVFMWGGPSQLDTWDLKPDAPAEVRGEFKPIETVTPGVFISEHFPRLARLSDQYAIVRSLTHDDPAHLSSAHHILTGHYAPKRFSDADPPSRADWPHIGSVMARLRPSDGAVPSFVAMPWTVMHPAAPGGRAPGQTGGWLGSRLDPMTVGDPSDPKFKVDGFSLPADLDADRFADRRQLLANADNAPTETDWRSSSAGEWSGLTARAFDLLSGQAAQQAFDLTREAESVRDRYGRNTHGQSLLMARRLVEAGVALVTVNWQNDGQNFWDTHGDNFNHLKNRLMPPADQGLSALLEDLKSRGLLEETLVVWIGEFGRRPHITREHAGREHWPRCFSAVLAGGGIRGGTVYGSSDRIAAFPNENPTSPSDITSTMYYALGVDEEAVLFDRQDVPKRIWGGRALESLF